MNTTSTPDNGDFAALVESQSVTSATKPAPASLANDAVTERTEQTLMDVLLHGEEPTPELLEALANPEPVVTDEELERQALEHPGADGDPNTPE